LNLFIRINYFYNFICLFYLEVYKNLKSQLTGSEIEDEIENFENIGNKEKIHLHDGNIENKKEKKKCCAAS